MAVLPQDRRGQLLLFLSIFAAAGLYFLYGGTPIGGMKGFGALGDSAQVLQNRIDSLQTKVTEAKRTLAAGALPTLQRRLDEYQANLALMRQLVPAGTEIPNLIDDIVSRARVRGAEPGNVVPQYPAESGSPFDTQRARLTVTGQYDQIGEFLADVASLPRIIVPFDVRLERIPPQGNDSTRFNANTLQVNFQIRTYVKPQVDSSAAAAPAPRGGT